MKKLLTIFCRLMAISVLLIYPQLIKGNTNTEKNSFSVQTKNNNVSSATTPTEKPKKVLMHYMGWYGKGKDGRHWEYGEPREPIIGYYNSQSWATQMYHILLSWSCGIDGLVINVKDKYDSLTMERLMPTLKSIREIDSTTFKYEFAISYDDQGMDVVGTDTAKTNFEYLRDKILPNNPNYLRYKDTAAIFIFNYKKNIEKKIPEYLTAQQYDSILKIVFKPTRPKVLWNEIDSTATDYFNTFYPWVQPDSKGWKSDGSNWGKGYLNWFYPAMANHHKHDFVIGGVWPGFDDRLNTEWGSNRWMDRKNGTIYDSTWMYMKNYNSNYPASLSPLKWVYIETWNDFNEGSEIEPSKEFGYKYLNATIKNINAFKDTTISEDTCKFLAALKIYEAADLIERNQLPSNINYPVLVKAIKCFILGKCDSAIIYVDNITSVISIKEVNNKVEFYPNPAKDKLYIRQLNNEPFTIQLTDIQGKVMLYLEGKKQLETVDISHFPKGIYLVRVKQNDRLVEKKIVVP